MHRLRLTEASDPPLTYAATAQSELSCSKSTIIHLQQIDHHPSASRHVMTLKHANHQRNTPTHLADDQLAATPQRSCNPP